MAENENIFDVTKSETAKLLLNMSSDELQKRYFTKNPTHETVLREDFNQELNKVNEKRQWQYTYITSIVGVNLNYIFSSLSGKIEGYIIDEGLKINIPVFFRDLENILKDHKQATAHSAAHSNDKTATQFIKEVSNFFVEIILNRAYLHEASSNYTA